MSGIRDEFEMLRALAAGGDQTAAQSLPATARAMLTESRQGQCDHRDRVEVTEMGQRPTYLCRTCGAFVRDT